MCIKYYKGGFIIYKKSVVDNEIIIEVKLIYIVSLTQYLITNDNYTLNDKLTLKMLLNGYKKTIDDYIVQLKNLSILKNSLSYSRLKKCLQECIATNACNSNKFIDELDEKINFHPDSFLSYGLPKFENIVSI